MGKLTNTNSRGFSILELLIGMAVFVIISGSILAGMGQYQANYRTAEVSVQMQQQLRSTMELMASEIGQAGLQASTVEGGLTGGDQTFVTPYRITSAITASASVQNVPLTAGTGVFSPYYGQWLMVDGGANQEPVQVQGIGGNTGTPCGTVPAGDICGLFSNGHVVNTAAYPMGVFPHGILSEQSNATSSGGGKLAMFGEVNGSGNGLWAVEYTCPTTFPGPLTRTVWSVNPLGSGTKYNLIDNVSACYFCWPGVPSTVNANCPTGPAAPDTVTLAVDPAIACPTYPSYTSITQPTAGSGYCTYLMITQVGFTITVTEPVTISGTSQNVTVTKSYSNVQPRNLVTADNIYKTACASALSYGASACTLATTPYTNYAQYLAGELQPDPPNLASITW